MIFNRYRDLFEDCAPAFWPWLWLQLCLLLAQKADDGRERLIMVTWWGHVCVLAVGDAPCDASGPARDAFEISFTPAFLSLSIARFPGDAPSLDLQPVCAPVRHLTSVRTALTPACLATLCDKSLVTAPG